MGGQLPDLGHKAMWVIATHPFTGHISGVPLGCQAQPQGGTRWVHPTASPSHRAGTDMESVRCYTGPWVLGAGD